MSWILKIAYWTQPNFYALAESRGKIQLLTIGFSHYVELARWSLQIKGIKFDEHAYAPGQHVFPVLAARMCGEKQVLSDSSFIMPVVQDETKEPKSAKSGRSTAVPLAIIPNTNEALADSWSIAHYAGLAPIDSELKNLLDVKLGPLARQLSYSFVLKHSSWFSEICLENQSWFFRSLWSLFMGSFLVKMLSKTFRPFDVDAVNKCRSELKEVISQCDDILRRRTGEFIGGDSLGVADVALCSLMAALVIPDEYANGMYLKSFTKLLDMDEDLRKEVEFWRSTETGMYTLSIYSKYRTIAQ